jgi:replication factor C small subunit
MKADLEKPWVEKYRPDNFDDIVSQNVAIKNLKKFVKSKDMPHMIFAGPAGTGKTSTALVIARTLIKSNNYYRNVLELNASDTVRMKYVRKELKDFVNQNMILTEKPLKIVILDEADNIPTTVQQTLRRIIESAPSNVKFILMCNYISKIIDPIISRCAVFRFVNLPKEHIISRLKYIAEQENLKIPKGKQEEFFNTLFFISGGDLRKAINTLQMAVALELIENLDVNEIFKVSGFVEQPILDSLLTAIEEKDFDKTKEIFTSIENYDSRSFIRQLLKNLQSLKSLKTEAINKIQAYFGDIDYRISQGADEEIQLLALLAEIIKESMN